MYYNYMVKGVTVDIYSGSQVARAGERSLDKYDL